jgi:ATP-dependent Clp protease ATP-binding subunit ClpC
MEPLINLKSKRAAEARLSVALGKTGYAMLMLSGILLVFISVAVAILGKLGPALLLGAVSSVCLTFAIWWKNYLSLLPVSGKDIQDRLSKDMLSLLKPGMALNPLSVWKSIHNNWQTLFITNHLLIAHDLIEACLSEDENDLTAVLSNASDLAARANVDQIEIGFIAGSLILTSPKLLNELTKLKLNRTDVIAVVNWLGRNLAHDNYKAKFGGIGRNWAFGFTPLLDRMGLNISQSIMHYHSNFSWLINSKGVKAIEGAFANHAAAVALIGPDGIGKTQSVHALAQKLIEGRTVKGLAYHEIVALNATDIVSRARRPGELEHLMVSLLNEAAHAGHVILFLDDAQQFLGNATGSFDASQILLSILQARSVPIIMALTPDNFQRLKSMNPSMAGMLTSVILQELDQEGVMHVLEDNALRLQYQSKLLITYQALKEAYRLSGRYDQDEAYPGKAIKLMEQSIPYASQSLITETSVQAAIEQTRGIKAAGTTVLEADKLLHLEAEIHKRMINQNHAVSVVANALRRARAGVTNPARPIGSFLFLGPTGVGKTELAKSLAATYFGSEDVMIRLDMSEYSDEKDVQRFLDSGQHKTGSLLMSVRQQPFSVVLLDEIEKAHPNILNLLLQMLDEGKLTDTSGRAASFKDCIIIATSNAGAQSIRERVAKGEDLDNVSDQLTEELISSGQFKPELLNRFDDMVFFRPLSENELSQVVILMVNEVNRALSNQSISIELSQDAVAKVVAEGNDPRLGARPMRRVLQKAVENAVAQKILTGEAKAGDHLVLDSNDLLDIEVKS